MKKRVRFFTRDSSGAAVVGLAFLLRLTSPITIHSSSLEPPLPPRRINLPGRTRQGGKLEIEEKKDSLERFSEDVENVLHNLRASEFCENPKIPEIYKSPIRDDEEWWDRHTNQWRYVRHLVNLPTKSRLFRRIIPQMIVLVSWSCAAISICIRDALFAKLHISLTSMSLISTFIAALLTLRSNQGLKRLEEARKAIHQVCLHVREMSQLIGANVYNKNPQLALLAVRHLSIFLWTLQSHLQGSLCNEDEVIRAMLLSSDDAQYIIDYKPNPPIAILLRLRQIVHHLSSPDLKIHKEVHKTLYQMLYRLNEALMTTERVRISPIPPLYTTHAARLLLFYLFWLPFALYGAMGGNAPAALLITIVVGYAMLGLDEISHVLELPFKFMPLRQLSKISMKDSADAIAYRPPPIWNSNDNKREKSENHIAIATKYW